MRPGVASTIIYEMSRLDRALFLETKAVRPAYPLTRTGEPVPTLEGMN